MNEAAMLTDESDVDHGSSGQDGASEHEASPPEGMAVDRWARRLGYASVLLPFVVIAVALVVVARDHLSVADHAGIEAHVRHVGRREVLVGLWSRNTWNHPGPLFFYLAAPLYWLTGGINLGIELTAVAINAASIAGMALLARRRGGTPLLLCTLVGCALMMRSIGTEFLHDPWNTFTPTLPYGLMLMLVWSTLCGDRWALPLAVLVASFAAQTHIGFMVLALPLVAGSAGLVVLRAMRGTDGEVRRDARRDLAAAAGISAVVWAPPIYDVLAHPGSNAGRIVDYFRHPNDATRTVAEGWRVMLAQFELSPEWLSGRQPALAFNGESPFLYDIDWPWLLVPVVAAAVVLWRRGEPVARWLVATLGAAFLLGVVGVWRTIGIGFQYRLWWTWLPAVLAGVMATWAGWREVARRWPWAERRLLVPGSLAVLGVLAVVNTGSALRADGIHPRDSRNVVALDQALDDTLDGVDGPVYVTGHGFGGMHYARGVLVQLERRGFEVRVPTALRILREFPVLAEDEHPALELAVATNDQIDVLEDDPDYRRVAEAGVADLDERADEQDSRIEEIEEDNRAGRLSDEELLAAIDELLQENPDECAIFACQVAVFVHEE